jgi:hypothetical protein
MLSGRFDVSATQSLSYGIKSVSIIHGEMR